MTENSSNSSSFENLDSNHVVFQHVIPNIILGYFIFGILGFFGNTIMYLQPELRSNTYCIYMYCSSIVDLIHLSTCVFPDYFQTKYAVRLIWNQSMFLCKLYNLLYCVLPQLANNFLILSIFDRFACTCPPSSRIYHFVHAKMISRVIFLVILFTCIFSIYGSILAHHDPIRGCKITHPEIYILFNIAINGFIQPIAMFILILLTLQNIRISRRRVVRIEYWRQDQIFKYILFCIYFRV